MRHLTAAVLLGAALQLGAQAPPPVFEVEEQVTAVDLMVSIDRGPFADPGKPADDVDTSDFAVIVDGGERPIVDVAVAAEDGLNRWDIALYFDTTLATTSELRWAADELGAVVPELTQLGPVAIVVAADQATIRVPPTTDIGVLRAVLGQLALEATGEQALVAHRLTYRTEAVQVGNDPESPSPEELAAAYLEDERRLVERRHDELLTALTERLDAHRSGRAVFLVTGPIAPRRDRFYGQPDTRPSDVRTVSRTLASYGWTTLVLESPPPEAELKKGVTIGKLRWRGFVGTWEEDRDPERARSYAELGRSLTDQERLEEAEDAYRAALRHFDRDAATAKEQAAVLWELGVIATRRGDAAAAGQAFQLAADLDPSRTHPVAELLRELEDDPGPTVLTLETGGSVIGDPASLRSAVTDLTNRIRVTYQSVGEPEAELRPVAVRYRGDALRATSLRWSRTATPDRLAEARVRRALELLDEGPGELPFAAEIDSAGDDRLRLTVVSDEGPEWLGGRRIRLSWVVSTPGAPVRVQHQVLTVGSEWSHSTLFDEPARDTLAAVVVEDLATGRWAQRVLDVGW